MISEIMQTQRMCVVGLALHEAPRRVRSLDTGVTRGWDEHGQSCLVGVGVSAWGDGSVGLERALVAAPQRAWGHTPESGLNGRCYGVSCTTTNKTYPDSSTRSPLFC